MSISWAQIASPVNHSQINNKKCRICRRCNCKFHKWNWKFRAKSCDGRPRKQEIHSSNQRAVGPHVKSSDYDCEHMWKADNKDWASRQAHSPAPQRAVAMWNLKYSWNKVSLGKTIQGVPHAEKRKQKSILHRCRLNKIKNKTF